MNYCLLGLIRESEDIINALNSFMQYGVITQIRDLFKALSEENSIKDCPWKCYGDGKRFVWIKPFKWAYEVWDAIYLDDIDRLRRLVNNVKEKISKDYYRGKLIISINGFRSDFYLRLLEYHYLLANSVLLEYSAHIPSAVSAEVPAVAISYGGGWDNVLYEGRCRFKFGGISQWHDGVIKVTGAGIELEGKLRVKSMNLTVLAIKAAARAAGVGEIHEKISYESITSYNYNARKGDVVIEAKGKKYVIKTDAASHIGKYLDTFVKS